MYVLIIIEKYKVLDINYHNFEIISADGKIFFRQCDVQNLILKGR